MTGCMTTPADYAERRERRRKSRLANAFVLLLLLLGGVWFRSGATAAVVGALIIGVGLPLVVTLLFFAGRRHGTDNWPASVPAWVLQQAGTGLRAGVRPESELIGSVTLQGDTVVWTPRAPALRLGAATLSWPATGARVERLWGPVPQSHLVLRDTQGRVADLWVRDPRDLAARLQSCPS